jgi:Fic family protein
LKTLRLFLDRTPDIPVATGWYLSDLGVAKGRQELFTRQSPQRLKILREHALIESTISSNRIEGVEIEPDRVRAVVLGKPVLRDRNEEEVRGYRNALQRVHESAARLPVSEATLRELHALCRGEIGDAGEYRRKDLDIVETFPDGRSRVRFRAVDGREVAGAMQGLLATWGELEARKPVPDLLALAAHNLDFLCVHPFRDGNGRVSRLLFLLQCYQSGLEVGRFISLERIVEQTKDRYYETLEESSRGWHEGKHDPWPYVNYLLYVLKTAYREFEERLGQIKAPRGEKSEIVLGAIRRLEGEFRVSDLQRECPGVSLDMIRHVLKELRADKQVECLGRGRLARWRRVGELGNRN